jgi:hypothetical protein
MKLLLFLSPFAASFDGIYWKHLPSTLDAVAASSEIWLHSSLQRVKQCFFEASGAVAWY